MENKERNQLVLLTVVGILGVLYAYFSFLIIPLSSEAHRLTQSLEEKTARIATQEVQLRKLKNAEAVESANADYDRLTDRLVQSVPLSPWVNCPAIFNQLATEQKLKAPKVRLAMMLPFKGVEQVLANRWALGFSEVDPLRFGSLLAELENKFPLGQVLNFSLIPNSTNTALEAEINLELVVHQ